MPNSMAMLIFSGFDRKYPFWVNLVQKSKLPFQAEIWCLTNLNIQNLVVMFIFFVSDPIYSFWGNLFQKSKFFVEAEI